MKLELQKFKHYPKQSRDGVAFSADLYIDGVKAGAASNSGQGWPTEIVALPGTEALINEAEKYFLSLPKKQADAAGRKFMIQPTLDNRVDELVTDLLNAKERVRYENALNKDCANHICIGTDNKYWKYKLPYHVMVLSTDKTQLGAEGPEYLIKRLRQIKAALKPDERILNDNIPAEILHQVFPPEAPKNE